jgi:hypothetical protein
MRRPPVSEPDWDDEYDRRIDRDADDCGLDLLEEPPAEEDPHA